MPSAAALAVASLMILVGVNKPYVLVAFAICTLVVSGILREWIRGTRSRHRRGEGYPLALARLIAGNRPRYGGYIVHLGVVLMALGVVGSSFYDVQRDVALASGESTQVGEYTVKLASSSIVERADRSRMIATVEAYRGDSFLGTYYPRRDYYPSFKQYSTLAAIRSTPIDDLYIIPGELLEDGRVVFRIYVNPMVVWIWVAGPVILIGLLVALWPQGKLAIGYASRIGDEAESSIDAVTRGTP